MRRIWKFPLVAVAQQIEAPGLNRLLAVGTQNGDVMLWAEVDDDVETRRCTVGLYPTGVPIDRADHYIGTIFDGPFVWHYYATEPAP